MPFDWRQYHELAKVLHLRPEAAVREASSRSAVSRAYYAVFCMCRNHARRKFGFPKNGGSGDHALLPSWYIERRQTDIGSKLSRLYGWRCDCDYEDDLPGFQYDLAMQTAEDILNLLLKLKNPGKAV